MKKMFGFLLCLLLIALCAVALADVAIDADHFPDEIFRKCVSQFDKDGDNILNDAEIAEVTFISCNGQGIASLEGIAYFTSLNMLNCFSNQLTNLDISQNVHLWSLDCGFNQLKELDVSNNTALESLS